MNKKNKSIHDIFAFFFRFRIIFVHLLPCVSLVTFNIMLFRAMKEAEKRRERLLSGQPNRHHCKVNRGGDTKDSKKIRDANRTTHMLIVVITVTINFALPPALLAIAKITNARLASAKKQFSPQENQLFYRIKFTIFWRQPLSLAGTLSMIRLCHCNF